MRVLFVLAASALAASAQQYRAFWADAFNPGFKTPEQVNRLLEELATAKANAVFVEIRRRGDSYYLQSLESPAQDPDYDPAFDALAYLIDRAHARGIEVHAWFPVYKVADPASPPQDPRHVWNLHGPAASGEDMWVTVSSKGALSQTTLDPGHPGVMQYLADVILEPARHYDLDGLHLDYIRYPEDADYGWNPVAVARFQRLTGSSVLPGSTDPAWAAFRRKQVSDLVRQIYLRAYEIRPSIKISASVITWGSGPANDAEFRQRDAYSRVFQDWRGMLEEGILDFAVPMNYFRDSVPAQAAWFNQWIAYEKDRQYRRAVLIGPAIYLNSVAESMAQLQRALEASAAGNQPAGVSFYSYASTNSTNSPRAEFYDAAGTFFREPAPPTDLAWKSSPLSGHLYGRLSPANDSAVVWLETETLDKRTMSVDATGFFGAVDLAPGRYRVRVELDGQEINRSDWQDLGAGSMLRFDFKPASADNRQALRRTRPARGGSPARAVLSAPLRGFLSAWSWLAGESRRSGRDGTSAPSAHRAVAGSVPPVHSFETGP